MRMENTVREREGDKENVCVYVCLSDGEHRPENHRE